MTFAELERAAMRTMSLLAGRLPYESLVLELRDGRGPQFDDVSERAGRVPALLDSEVAEINR
jgi:hypothetical protein